MVRKFAAIEIQICWIISCSVESVAGRGADAKFSGRKILSVKRKKVIINHKMDCHMSFTKKNKEIKGNCKFVITFSEYINETRC